MIQFELDRPLDLGRLPAAQLIHGRWLPRDALYLAGNELGCRGLRKEAAARQRIGLPLD